MLFAIAPLRCLGLQCAFALVLAGCAAMPTTHGDERAARTGLLALLQTLNADLLAHDSATLTLERWCGEHALATPARIVARRVRGPARPLPEDLRARLDPAPGATIRYRHVQLVCGTHVLSDADNWYVVERLTPAMNRTLDSSDAPFGKVVAPLGFRRRTLDVQLLWSPLPQGWEMTPAAVPPTPLRIPAHVLRHEAVLYTAAQIPFSVVVESYTNGLFDFGRWAAFVDRD